MNVSFWSAESPNVTFPNVLVYLIILSPAKPSCQPQHNSYIHRYYLVPPRIPPLVSTATCSQLYEHPVGSLATAQQLCHLIARSAVVGIQVAPFIISLNDAKAPSRPTRPNPYSVWQETAFILVSGHPTLCL